MKPSFRSYVLITCGAVIQGFSMALFLFPNSIPSGGAGGLAVLLNYWFNLPLSFALWSVNFSLLVVAVYWLGNASAIGTMYGISITSLSIHFFTNTIHIPSTNLWIDLLLGSVILGFGIGILLRQGVSNGGMGVIALLFSKYRNIPPGRPLFILNGFIFILTAYVIDWRIIFLALISQFISTHVVDIIFKLEIHPRINQVKHKTEAFAWRKK